MDLLALLPKPDTSVGLARTAQVFDLFAGLVLSPSTRVAEKRAVAALSRLLAGLYRSTGRTLTPYVAAIRDVPRYDEATRPMSARRAGIYARFLGENRYHHTAAGFGQYLDACSRYGGDRERAAADRAFYAQYGVRGLSVAMARLAGCIGAEPFGDYHLLLRNLLFLLLRAASGDEVPLAAVGAMADLTNVAFGCAGFLVADDGGFVLYRKPSRVRMHSASTFANPVPHCEDGPAIAWRRERCPSYFLHGVHVPEKLVMTPADRLVAATWLRHGNGAIRAQAIRKIGYARLCDQCGATPMDRRGDYELLTMSIAELGWRATRWLRMRNPSTGVVHVEPVAPACVTVEDALRFRNGVDGEPVILT